MPSPRRLAITISGAVSLGSYEAGVLFEILEALRRNNTHPDAVADSSKRVEIDVLCGASAGGMTAAIAAQSLLDTRGRDLEQPFRNPFYRPWVLEADLDTFLKDGPDDRSDLSLLASSQVQRIAERHLANTVAEDAVPHPAVAPTLKLGLAMSNLQGVDYHRETLGANGEREEFIYTRFQDEFLRTVRKDGRPGDHKDWPVIREAALACGAFPFAFRARDISRRMDEYAARNGFDRPQFEGKDTRAYTYVDGGAFHNEPLGMARDLVKEINPRDDSDTRFYLFVSPDAQASKRPETKRDAEDRLPERLRADTCTLGPLLKHLLGAIYTQARFQDWIMASKVNERVHLLDQVAAALAEALLDPPPVAAGHAPLPVAIATVADVFLDRFFPGVGIDQELGRLRDAYTGFKDAAGVDYLARLPDRERTIWLKAVLLFEKSARLEDKDAMTIFTITASTKELAGDPLFSFGGFLSDDARKHDYAVGRQKAQDWLTKNACSGGRFELLGHDDFPQPAPAPDPALAGMTMKDTPAPPRRMLRDRIASRGAAALGWSKIFSWIPALILSKLAEKKLGLGRDNPPRRGPRV